MELSNEDIILVCNKFPKVEPCYENIINRSIMNADIILAIPEGIKCFLFFTTYKQQNVCFLLEIKENKKAFSKVSLIQLQFHHTLSFGTIFYGTFLKINEKKCVAIEDVFYYKGKNISNMYFNEKLEVLDNFFDKNMNNIENLNISIYMCDSHSNEQKLNEMIKSNNYKIKFLNFRYYDSIKKSLHLKYKKSLDYIVVNVKAQIESDIYKISALDYKKNMEIEFDTLYVSNYDTSKVLNGLFRNIKENGNIDLLEESDDEDEFENIESDRYVFLDRIFRLKCKLNKKFNKWYPVIPLEITKEKLTRLDEIQSYM